MILNKHTLVGGLWLLSGNVATGILRIASTAALARLILPQEYGLIVEAATLVAFLAVAVEMGLGQALVQRQEIEGAHESTAFSLTVVASLVAATTAFLLSGVWSAFRSLPEIKGPIQILAFSLLLRAPATVPRMLMLREMRMKEAAAIQLVGFVVQSCVSIFLGWAGLGAWALAWGVVAGAVSDMGIFFLRRPVKNCFRFSRSHARDLMVYGGGFTVARIANTVALQGDLMVIGLSLGPTSLSFYSRAYNLLAIPASILDSIDGAIFPALSRHQNDRTELARAFRAGLSVVATIIIPASVFFAIVAPEVVRILMGPRWGGVVEPLAILAPTMYFRTAYKPPR